MMEPPLRVKDLVKYFPIAGGLLPRAEERCSHVAPLLREIAPGRLSACHFST